jgi:hypothetical protein
MEYSFALYDKVPYTQETQKGYKGFNFFTNSAIFSASFT